MKFQDIKLEKDGEIGRLVLNRPDKFNALSRRMVLEMTEALETVQGDRSIRILIIKTDGRHFCVGHDMSEMVDKDAAVYRDIFEKCTIMMTKIHELPQPVVAQVNGLATAAGCQLVAAGDLVVAEENAMFATPGVRIGLFCCTPMVPLYRAIGRKRSLEMLLTGRDVSAREAEAWGLVNRVTSKEQLEEETRRFASSIIEASPLTIEIGKETFYAQVDRDEGHAYDVAKNVMAMSLSTCDAQEGIKAFLEKRKPTWQGK
jgi:enoyl-CoA hydratase/carnithine racemase